MSKTAADTLASALLVPEGMMKLQIAQIVHRQDILQTLGSIPEGSKVLELGCGQGDCTIVLLDLVGESGKVDAIDPAPLGYGAPYTVHEAQAHISTSTYGKRVSFIRGEPLSVLPDPPQNRNMTSHTLERLKELSKTIYIAEWSLSTSVPEAEPHVLAALTQASLECRKPQSDSNVRTVVSPDAIKKLAEKAGLKLVKEGVVVSNADVNDGKWEVHNVKPNDFLKEVEESVKDERERAVVVALRDAVLSGLEKIEGEIKGVRSMDVWCGAFEKA